MQRVQFKYIPFTQNILQTLLEDANLDNSLYIFPTEAGKRAAIRELQNLWAFQNIQFLTMEELKELLFFTDKPLLKEEKRTLAFYVSLTDADREFFKISNYFQSIELAHHFFDLWEEFNEELLPENFDILHLQQADAELLNWQIQTYNRLKNIKKKYLHVAGSLGSSDIIFLYKKANLSPHVFQTFQSIHFVNQFYYTKLEREIIDTFSQNDKQVILYYQLAENLVNADTLAIKPFTMRDLGQGRTEQIDIFECSNEFTMLQGLIQQVHAGKVRHVVNFSAVRHPYARFLSPVHFNLGSSQNFTTTSIFQFFQTLHAVLESLMFEPSQNKLLLPIQAVLDALLNVHLSDYLLKESKDSRPCLLDYLYDLLDQEYKFIDLDDHFFLTRKKHHAVEFLFRFLNFIKSLLDLHSISSLINKIDAPMNGIKIEQIMTEPEKNSSNLCEIFYRALADFRTLETMGIVKDWHSLLKNQRLAPQIQIPAGLLQLFLDYLRSRTVRYNLAPAVTPRVEFIDLQDTRNIFYRHVAVMNVVEKEIPTPRQTPFLFSERQRQLLGLKTYDDIKLREKYYFMRLVLTTPRVSLLTQKNIEQNIDISSFLEEIRLDMPADKIRISSFIDENYRTVYNYLLHSQSLYRALTAKVSGIDFYTIPLQLERDLPQRHINLSYYALANLLSNAFTFYIKNVIRLDERSKSVSPDYSPMLIGNIVHECLNDIWRDILEQHMLQPVINFVTIPDEQIDKAVDKTLQSERFYYSSPHNHAQIYFLEIVKPRIKLGIRQFFNFLDRIGLSRTPLEIFPEQDDVLSRDNYIPYVESEKINFAIHVGGRADLRIESPDKSFYYIFDYKTGGSNREQLILYELYYYLIQQKAAEDKVFSYFYYVMDAQGKELREFNRRKSKPDVIEEFNKNVREHVNKLWKSGFVLPEKKNKLEDMADISRADLYVRKFLPLKNRNGLL